MSNQITSISVRIGVVARQAHLARTGLDPGDYIEMEFVTAPDSVRAALARYYSSDLNTVVACNATDTTPEAVYAALLTRAAEDDAREQQHAETRRQIEHDVRAYVAEALLRPVQDWITSNLTVAMPILHDKTLPGDNCYGTIRDAVPGYAERMQEAKAYAARLRQEEAAREQAAREEKAAAEAAKEVAKQTYLADWVSAHGDAELQQQYADGLCCRDELVSLVANDALKSLPPEVDPFIGCNLRACPCGRTDVTCLPRQLYPLWRELRATLPEGSTWEIEIWRRCLSDVDDEGVLNGEPEAGDREYVVILHVPVGPFRFKRIIALE